MSHLRNCFLFWSPRLLAILLAVFLGIFALDVFYEAQGFWRTTLGLAIHLVPSATIALILVAAWRREWIGAVLFAVLALLYARHAFPLHASWAAAIASPLLAVAALFLADWIAERRRVVR